MSDKRRPDLAIPYVHRPDAQNEMPSSVVFKSLPMIAMFMRSKVLAWAGLFMTMLGYLSQPVNSSGGEDPMTLSNVLTGIIGVVVSYMDFVVAQTPKKTA